PETLRRIHRMADLREITGFFRLPIPGRDGCPGIALDSGLSTSSGNVGALPSGVVIGRFIEGTRVTQDEAAFLPNDLAKHGLIVGTPGSGKTSLTFSLLTQLWERHHLPFLVLEPAKTEYRALAMLPCFRENLLVFTVGNERTAPFRFNPFEIQEGVSVAEHISSLNTCFAGAFNLFDPLPMLLDQAIRTCYAERGWSEYEVGGETPGLEPPTMADLYRTALQMAEQSSYKGETMGNIRGALETRLGALLRGPKGRCFNTRRSVPMATLLANPVVLELEALNDEEKALLMLFLLTALRAYARANRKSGGGLQHIVMVEEAHNLIGRGEGQNGGHTANPKEIAVRFFVRMLAEMRALGEGILIADQLPTAIAPEAIKSTNLKVMHRIVAAEDRQELGQAMAFDGGQFQQAALLPPGHSLVFQEGWAQSRLVQEPDFKSLYPETAIPPDDREVKARMDPVLGGASLQPVYLPYRECSALCTLCTPRVREQTERWIERKRPQVAQERQRRPTVDPARIALEEILGDFDAPPEEALRWHCLRVHFQAEISSASTDPKKGRLHGTA
ncbi:MAG: hypothetical protein JWN14_1742, partial [Chthonomonadales bacterium]|nr:hypothetical protein [Chthonomonadales bacterium]